MPSGYKKEPVKTVNGVTYWNCTKCGEVKPRGEFQSRKNRPSPRSHCKSCATKYANQRYARKREALGHKVGEKRSDPETWSSVDRASAEWKKRNKERVNNRVRDYRRKFPERARAREAVQTALNSGRLVKAKECEMCGRAVRLTGHHDSYEVERRLVVIWLCGKCHAFIHRQRDDQEVAREVAAQRAAYAQAAETAPEPASEPTQTSVFDMLGEDNEDN
jgi:ribosomal protein S27AE